MNAGIDLTAVAPLLIPILALSLPIVAIVMGAVAKMRRTELMHETVRQLIAQGREIPPELLRDSGPDSLRESAARVYAAGGVGRQHYFGAINVAVGLGLMVMFYAMNPGEWLWAIGCLPLFVGLAVLLVWRLEKKR